MHITERTDSSISVIENNQRNLELKYGFVTSSVDEGSRWTLPTISIGWGSNLRGVRNLHSKKIQKIYNSSLEILEFRI